MYLQEILEVAIGLVFAWLVLSIATMQIQEWWNTIFQVRAKTLEDRIATMLASANLKDEFYNHPILQSLGTPAFLGKERKPSYIPAQQFSKVLFDILRTAGTEDSLIRKHFDSVKEEFERQVAKLKDDPQGAKQQAARDAFEAIRRLAEQALKTQAGSDAAKKALEEAKKKTTELAIQYPELKPIAEQTLPQILDGIETYLSQTAQLRSSTTEAATNLKKGIIALRILSPNLKHTLDTLIFGLEEKIDQGEAAIFQARKNVEEWFDASMERLSGLFKRRAQVSAFVIGLISAVLVNVDAIQISTLLWREPTIRQAIVANADKFVAERPEGMGASEAVTPAQAVNEFKKQFAGLDIPLGWKFEVVDLTQEGTAPKACVFEPTDPATETFGIYISNKFILKLLQLEQGCYHPVETTAGTSGSGWLTLKILGFLISALATVQGAPFWFDILKKLVNVRGSGANPIEEKK